MPVMPTTIAIGKSLLCISKWTVPNGGTGTGLGWHVTDRPADSASRRLGGEVVAEEVGAPGFDHAGYANVETSDCIRHGQVKQSGAFSFSRIYERYLQALPALSWPSVLTCSQWARSSLLSAFDILGTL